MARTLLNEQIDALYTTFRDCDYFTFNKKYLDIAWELYDLRENLLYSHPNGKQYTTESQIADIFDAYNEYRSTCSQG